MRSKEYTRGYSAGYQAALCAKNKRSTARPQTADELSVGELRWLARQTGPVWGGHIQRGEPLTCHAIKKALEDGLICRSGNGYIITDLGRACVPRA